MNYVSLEEHADCSANTEGGVQAEGSFENSRNNEPDVNGGPAAGSRLEIRWVSGIGGEDIPITLGSGRNKRWKPGKASPDAGWFEMYRVEKCSDIPAGIPDATSIKGKCHVWLVCMHGGGILASQRSSFFPLKGLHFCIAVSPGFSMRRDTRDHPFADSLFRVPVQWDFSVDLSAGQLPSTLQSLE